MRNYSNKKILFMNREAANHSYPQKAIKVETENGLLENRHKFGQTD